MDRLEAMALLREVVDRGSFSAAARSLGIPVPTLSRKVAELETHLGIRLLVRTTRKMSLTDAGARFVSAARRILEQMEEAEREAAGEFEAPKGEVVMTAPVHFGRLYVLPLVVDFLALHPAISVRLILTDHNIDLIDDNIDLALRIGRLGDSTNVATRLGSMRVVVCASPTLLGGRDEPSSPTELRDFPMVVAEGPLPSERGNFQHGRSPFGWSAAARLTVTTTEAAVFAATRHIGAVQLLHYQVADAISSGSLRVILREFEPEPLPIHLVHAERGRLPLKLRSFLDFLTPALRFALRPHA